MTKKSNYKKIYDTCKNHMHAYVLIEMTDGQKYDGIITGLDEQHVYLAVPIGERNLEERNYSYGSPYGGYGGRPPYYGGGYYPPQRFERLVLPLAALAALSLLPWY